MKFSKLTSARKREPENFDDGVEYKGVRSPTCLKNASQNVNDYSWVKFSRVRIENFPKIPKSSLQIFHSPTYDERFRCKIVPLKSNRKPGKYCKHFITRGFQSGTC